MRTSTYIESPEEAESTVYVGHKNNLLTDNNSPWYENDGVAFLQLLAIVLLYVSSDLPH